MNFYDLEGGSFKNQAVANGVIFFLPGTLNNHLCNGWKWRNNHLCVCVRVKISNHQTETTINKNCCLEYQVGVSSDPKPPKMLVSHSDIVSILTLSP